MSKSEDFNHEEQIARLRAEVEQGIEATKNVAKAVSAYNRQLKEEGISSFEALQLTIAYQTSLIESYSDGNDE